MMNPSYREIHRSEICRRLEYRYWLFCRGVYTAAMFAGFVGGLLTSWPVVLICYLLVVVYAIKGSISREKLNIWARIIWGWLQYAYLFIAGFLASLSIVKGWGPLFGIPIILFAPAPLYYYNKKLHFRLFHFNVAREYLREISAR